MEQTQRNLDAEQMQQQQLKLRDRQKFFEEVFQHDVDFFFPMSHLQIEHRRRKCWGHQHGAEGVSGSSDTGVKRWAGHPQSMAAGDAPALHWDGTTQAAWGRAVGSSHHSAEVTAHGYPGWRPAHSLPSHSALQAAAWGWDNGCRETPGLSRVVG